MDNRRRFRHVLVLTGLLSSTVTDGYIFGQMSGMVNTLKSEDSDIKLTDDEISWITATINVTCIFGYILASFVAKTFGRRHSISVETMPVLAIWILVYYAQSFTVLLITRILLGICFGGMLFFSCVSAGEYASPNYRGVYLNLVSSGGTAFGTMLGHVLSCFFHWRTVALLGIIPTSLAVVLPFFWVESPSWLASKGRFKECEIAFRALHGDSKEAEKELQLLIDLEREKQNKGDKEAEPFIFDVKKVKLAMAKRYFWNIAALMMVVNIYRVFANKVLFSTLAITMMQQITKSSDIVLFTFIVDGFALTGGLLSCVFISKMKMRTLLFSTAVTANVFLLALSACMYFKSENNIYVMWANCLFLALYFICINAGPYPALEALFGEIFPLEIKAECPVLFGTASSIMFFVYVRYAPNVYELMGYSGGFLLNTIVLTATLVYFWFFLPETKGRTLQEIELYFKSNNTFENIDSKWDPEQATELIK